MSSFNLDLYAMSGVDDVIKSSRLVYMAVPASLMPEFDNCWWR